MNRRFFGLLVCAAYLASTAAHAQVRPASTATAGQVLRTFLSQHQSLAGDFVQTTLGKSGQQTGSFALHKPTKFRWSLQKPYEQLIVSDGKTITQWDADLNQATLRSASDLLSSTPVALLLGGADLDKLFTLSNEANDQGLVWVMAVPKAADTQFKQIKLGFKDGLPIQLQIQDAFGGTSNIQFKNLTTAPVPADRFSFTPPKGADIVKM